MRRRLLRATPRSPAAVALTLLALAGVTLILFGSLYNPRVSGATEPLPRAADSPASSPAPAATDPRLSAPLPTGGAVADAVPRHQPGLGPSSLRIPGLDVTAAIGTAPVVHGVLSPPVVPMTVGAWEGSAALDADSGEVTLAGHVNWAGMAPFAFARLAELHPGDLIYTSDQQSEQTAWRITAVTARPKTSGVDPTAFAGPSGPRSLVLITCGGNFDTDDMSYDDNVYVRAVPIADLS